MRKRLCNMSIENNDKLQTCIKRIDHHSFSLWMRYEFHISLCIASLTTCNTLPTHATINQYSITRVIKIDQYSPTL